MPPIIKTYHQLVGKLVSAVHKVNVWLLMPSLLALVVADIILRNIFSSTLSWSHEVSGLLLLCIFFIDLPYCLFKSEFLKVDLLFSFFSKFWQSMAHGFALLCCLGLSIFLIWQALVGLQDMYEFEEQALTLAVPLWPFSAMIAVSAFLMVLQSLSMLIENWQGLGGHNERS
jgi:TRAP-type C4-dicarboxylate transport system permease small subunit